MPKKASKVVMPDPLPNGEILTDISKKTWCLGPSIGKGGFGEIYSAAEYKGTKKNLNYQNVIKIEPHANGPLFCEMHFFLRSCKPDMISKWCSEKKLSILGVPRYLGSGSHEHNQKKYRFLVMDKYGKDLWNIFLENKKIFPVHTVFRLGLQLIDSLEYIHSNGYCHADLKGANILLGSTKQTQNQVFLVDFGLASKYTQTAFKPDPKKAHDGTIEYTSRDAHDGVPTRRGDIEILAYNIIQWLGCVLPWEKKLTNPVVVQQGKIKYMCDINAFMKCCFEKRTPPGAVIELLNYVSKMSFDTEPDYKKIRAIFTKGLKTSGGSISGPLEFKTSSKHKNDDVDSSTPEKKLKLIPNRRSPRTKFTAQKSESEDESESENDEGQNDSESENEPQHENKSEKKNKKVNVRSKKLINANLNVETNTNGFNAEMLRLQKRMEERNAGKTKKSTRTAVKSNGSVRNGNGSGINLPNSSDYIDDVIEATPPEKINSIRKKRAPVDYSEDASPRERRKRR